MADEFLMVYDAVRQKANQINGISQTLSQVVQTLEGISNMLKSNWFLGMCGGYALAAYIDSLKPQIQQVVEKCAEMCQDMLDAATKAENGDQEGAELFAEKWGAA